MKILLLLVFVLSLIYNSTKAFSNSIYGDYETTASCSALTCPNVIWTLFEHSYNFTCPAAMNPGALIYQNQEGLILLNFSNY